MSKPAKLPDLAHARGKFIEAGGSTTQSFGLGRLVGQIYALLYLSPEALCLDEIATELGVSKASISVTIRQMEEWHAVRNVWVKGDRRDFYECEPEFRTILKDGILATLRKKLDTAGVQLACVESLLLDVATQSNDHERKSLETVAGRLKQAKSFHNKLQKLVNNPLVDHLI